jgi:hypothetical protein
MRTFLKAIRTGKTNTIEALDVLFADPAAVVAHAGFAALDAAGAVNTLQPWARTALRGLGLATAELDHIDEWDAGQKELVRQAVVHAAKNGFPVEFFWQLTDAAAEDIAIVPGPPKATITFLSPERRVKTVGPDNVVVDVGV